jgi:hypothetical protein
MAIAAERSIFFQFGARKSSQFLMSFPLHVVNIEGYQEYGATANTSAIAYPKCSQVGFWNQMDPAGRIP